MNKQHNHTHAFPIAFCIGEEQLQNLKVQAELAMSPVERHKLFRRLLADSRKPYKAREYKTRIGALPAQWLRDALNLPKPLKAKKGEPRPPADEVHNEMNSMLWTAVDKILANTERALANGSPRPIMEELFEQTKPEVDFWAGFIGQPRHEQASEEQDTEA